MPLYIFHGSEALPRKEAFDRLRAELDSDGSLATNTITFEATSATPEEVISACDTLPFLGDRRLVVVEGLLATAGRKRARKKPITAGEEEPPNPWLALVDYLDRMPETTTLVLVDDTAPATGLLKDLGPKGKVESFAPVHENALPAWVTERAKQMGVKIEPAAAKLLAELVGPSSEGRRRKTQGHMMLLASELDKLAAYANGEVIGEKDVRALVSRAKEHKGWDLTDAISKGQRATAARVLEEMIDDGGILPVILSTVAGRYRRLAVVKDMVESGATSAEIASRLGMKQGYGVDKLVDEARSMSMNDIRDAYQRLIDAELDVKRLGMDEQTALELAVEELAWRNARPAVRSR